MNFSGVSGAFEPTIQGVIILLAAGVSSLRSSSR
jgi:hypothetical protein